MDEIISIICNFYNVDPSLVLSKSRKKELVRVRFVCWFFIQKNLNISTQKIGNKFNRNHASVLHGISVVNFEYETYEDFRAEIKNIWLRMKFSVEFEKYDIKENVYREIIMNLVTTDINLFKKLNLEPDLRSWIYKDLKIDKEQIKKIEDV